MASFTPIAVIHDSNSSICSLTYGSRLHILVGLLRVALGAQLASVLVKLGQSRAGVAPQATGPRLCDAVALSHPPHLDLLDEVVGL